MTEQEQFEADYLAAFPHRDGLMGRYANGRYVCIDIQDSLAVWQQQAARHKAEIAELLSALKVGLDCAIECSNTERCASMAVYKQSRVEAAQSDVNKIRATIAKYEEKQ